MAKFLDANGVQVLWRKIKESFLPVTTDLLSENKVQELIDAKEQDIKNWTNNLLPKEEIRTLSERLAEGGIITLTKDETITEHVYLRGGGSVVLDLAGRTLTEENCSIILVKGELTIKNGMIYHTGNANQALKVVASTEPIVNNAVLNLSANLRILSPDDFGVFITPQAEPTDAIGQYGAVINCDCEIQSKYVPLYLNGLILDKGQAPCKINIGKTAKLYATNLVEDMGVGLYAAGFGEYSVSDGAQISGLTGIELRAGELAIDGGFISSFGNKTEISANGNGSTSRGAALAVAPHTSNQPITLIINNGVFTGPTAFIEQNIQQLADIGVLAEINGGIFTGAVFAEDLTNFISKSAIINDIDSKYLKEEA